MNKFGYLCRQRLDELISAMKARSPNGRHVRIFATLSGISVQEA